MGLQVTWDLLWTRRMLDCVLVLRCARRALVRAPHPAHPSSISESAAETGSVNFLEPCHLLSGSANFVSCHSFVCSCIIGIRQKDPCPIQREVCMCISLVDYTAGALLFAMTRPWNQPWMHWDWSPAKAVAIWNQGLHPHQWKLRWGAYWKCLHTADPTGT